MDDLLSKIEDAFSSTLLDIADEYQQNSPIGVTGGLRRGWDVSIDSNPDGFRGVISNDAPFSKYRALGRGAGKAPPIDTLTPWVQQKIEPNEKKARAIAFVIGRKISKEGTNRYRDNTNPFYLNRDGSIKPELKQKFINLFKKHYRKL